MERGTRRLDSVRASVKGSPLYSIEIGFESPLTLFPKGIAGREAIFLLTVKAGT